jgi:hypothetical protein
LSLNEFKKLNVGGLTRDGFFDQFLWIIPIILMSSCTTLNKSYHIEKRWSFKLVKIEGWHIYLENEVARNQPIRKQLIELFKNKLKHLNKTLPISSLNELKKINIWISNESNYPFRGKERATFVYHVSPEWLKGHLLPKEMVNGIHLINPDTYLNDYKAFKNQPMAILHEFSHGYHHECMSINNIEINKAYNNAKKSRIYEKVKRKGSDKIVKSYALTNSTEYFAELSESYFGENDYYPYTKKELKSYDPVGFAMIEKIWGSACDTKRKKPQ